ncbi:MAG: carboxymuconolactone decarboxylase family protein [Frankiaceae bacterium]
MTTTPPEGGGALLRVASRRALGQIRYVEVPSPDAASGPIAEVYGQMVRDFGMLAPPVALHAPAPDVLAASWVMLRETLIASGSLPRAAKEAVATAVSLANACPYCVDVHGTTLHGLLARRDAAAVAGGRFERVTDPRVRWCAEWATAGAPPGPAGPQPDPADAAQAVGVALTFHYLNRVVNVFVGEPLLPPLPLTARDGMSRLIGRLMRSRTARHVPPGLSLGLLPPAPLPADLTWAAGDGTVGDALARSAAVIEAAGDRSVPVRVRDLVTATVAAPRARPQGPGRAWLDEAVTGLPAGERPAGRLALLTALASYQVTRPDVAHFRETSPDDAALVELVAWSSLAAARRAAGRMAPASSSDHFAQGLADEPRDRSARQ